MNEAVKFLTENPVHFLATVGLDGRAKCRPFLFCLEHDGKLWYCTNNQKEVYKEIMANPFVEFTALRADNTWIRLSGKVVFESNMQAKEACIKIPSIGGIYKEASNPIFEVFYLADAKAVIADFSGNPPREFKL